VDTFEISLFIICYGSCNGSKRRHLLVRFGTDTTISMAGLTTPALFYIGLSNRLNYQEGLNGVRNPQLECCRLCVHFYQVRCRYYLIIDSPALMFSCSTALLYFPEGLGDSVKSFDQPFGSL